MEDNLTGESMSQDDILLLIINSLIPKKIEFTVGYSESTGDSFIFIASDLYVYLYDNSMFVESITSFMWDEYILYDNYSEVIDLIDIYLKKITGEDE